MAEAAALAFDAESRDYDQGFGRNPVGLVFRHVFQERLRALFAPGSRVLDIGCGTGEDAAFLAGLGVRVLATDVAPGMVERAHAKARERGVGPDDVVVEIRKAEDVGALADRFDGACSNFGALNCADLARVGAGLASALRPGAPVILSLMGPSPLPGTLKRLLTGRGERRGSRHPRVAGIEVPTRYPTPREVRDLLGPAFAWSGGFALGVLLPDPSHEAWVREHSQSFGILAALEGRVRRWPLLRGLGDHVVLEGDAALMRAKRLELLVLAISNHCDQKCAHCQIWMGAEGGSSLSLEQRLEVVDDALASGTRAFLLTGGEPLLSADLWPLAERIRTTRAKLMLATNGMLLERYAERVAGLFDEVYVSLDGASASTHDGLRGVAAFERLRSGIAALRAASKPVRIVARCTLHAGNLREFPAIVEAARSLGAHHVSFLPIDASSAAFGGDAEARRRLVPEATQLRAFEAALDVLEASRATSDGFVLEPVPKLRRLSRHLGASAGLAAFERPECDAPAWSSVVESDGTVRPCFFHAPVGDARTGLLALRASPAYREALAFIDASNATCDRCVCPKRSTPGWLSRA